MSEKKLHYRTHYIQRGEAVPEGTRVRWRTAERRNQDEIMRVVGDDYVQYHDIGPTTEDQRRLTETKAKIDNLDAEIAAARADLKRLQITVKSTSFLATTGASETLQVITRNASGEAVLNRVLRREVEARVVDQDVSTSEKWTDARAVEPKA